MVEIKGYNVFEKVHSSKHTVTYRGLRLRDKQSVVLKLPSQTNPTSKDIALLQNEYQLLNHLSIPGVSRVYDLIQSNLIPVLVLDDVGGISLAKFVEGQPLDLTLFFQIALQLTDIIGQLHLCHIIHKDIKPDNIIIQPETTKITLIDFSIASQLSEEIQEYVSTNILEGSLQYLSPEQTGRVNCPIDYRSDFYSLGVTLFEMLTGQLPFHGNDSSEWVYCHIAKPPLLVTEFNPDLPDMISAIISKLLAKMPEDRYASTVGLKADLKICQQQWEQKKQIKLFRLAQYDIYDHLHIPSKLYSREVEVGQLLAAFDRVMQGSTELLLVSGYAGVGKTALIKEVHKSIAKQNGYFINGKFDQLLCSDPYGAIIAAIRGLVHQILTEPEDKLEKIRESLLKSLGNIGQVIIEIVPEMKLIIGEQPEIPELPTVESQNRFNSAFRRILQGLATAEHPLVIFLDDMQWADMASLRLIEMTLTSSRIGYVFVIAAYRSNEVSVMHPLINLIKQLKENHAVINTIELSPLKLSDTRHLLADTFNCQISRVADFANAIQEKTEGNPFFINQFLKMLYQKYYIWFSYEQGEWQWDLSQIKQQAITVNVISLLMARIHILSDEAQLILKLASCIGYQFNLKTLIIISEKNFRQVAMALWEAIKSNLVVALEDTFQTYSLIEVNESIVNQLLDDLNYRFIHDRVQQASYELIPDDVKKNTHLKIGRLLLKSTLLAEDDERLFAIMDQFNHSLDLLTNSNEKHAISNYNWWAGKKALSVLAYQTASTYLKHGLALFEPVDWKKDYHLLFSLYRDLSVAQYHSGEFDEAQLYFDTLLEHANSNIDKVTIYRLNIEMFSVLNKHREALQLGLMALRLLGIKLPTKSTPRHILAKILQIKLQLLGKKIENIKLLPMTSPVYRAAVDLISQLYNDAFIVDQRLYVNLVCTNMSLSLKYGYTNSALMACVAYAFVLIHVFHWYLEGMAFIGLYDKLKDIYGDPYFGGKNNLIIGGFIDPWRFPADKCVSTLQLGSQLSRDTGFISYCNYSNMILVITLLKMGKPLNEVQDQLNQAIDYIETSKIKDLRSLAEFWSYAIQCLEGTVFFEIDKLQQYEKEILANKNYSETNVFYSQCVKLCYLLGSFAAAHQAAMKHQQYVEYGMGLFSNPECDMFHALTLCAIYKVEPDQQRFYQKILDKIHRRFQRWSNWCADNYQLYLFLLDAELARIHHHVPDAMKYYEQAIKAAQQTHDLKMLAVINECAGRFYLDLDLPKVAQAYLSEAYYAYQRWGGIAKCKILEQYYQVLESDHATHIPAQEITPQVLEMTSLLKFTQTVASEIELGKLLQKFIQIILENAGAQRSILMTKQDNQWVVEAEGTFSEQQIYFNHAIPLALYNNLPLTLIQYAQRVTQPILIDNATLAEQTRHDPYIVNAQVKSVLLLPVFYQGNLNLMLYLEHRDSSGVFTHAHLQGLQLLTSQAVISIENAHLYYQATHDPLTGLANRNLLQKIFAHYAEQVKQENKKIAFLFIDLDYFKWINDTLGHEIGDQLLIYIANQLLNCLGEGDVAARLGGDEFIIMLTDINQLEQINRMVYRIFDYFNKSVRIDGHTLHLTSSMGISLFPDDGKDLNELINRADVALYKAKERGRNCFQYYSPLLSREIQETHCDEIELQHAIDNKQLCLYYQPIYDAQSKRIISLEALIRWNHPKKGLLDASYIIPLAEKTGIIVPIGEWALWTACQQAKSWQKKGLSLVPIAVNLSALQTKYTSISQLVSHILQTTQLDPHYLELELTETSFIENSVTVLNELSKLYMEGVHLTLDDFGTGYSALGYLKRIPLSKLKIDQSFIRGLSVDIEDRTIILAIIAIAHHLNLQVIAEGVEREEQYEFLREHKVDGIQGHYFMPPLDADSCETLLVKQELVTEKEPL